MTETFMWLLSDKLSLVTLMLACILLLLCLVLITRFDPIAFRKITVSPRARAFSFAVTAFAIGAVAIVLLVAHLAVHDARTPTVEKQRIENVIPQPNAQTAFEWCTEKSNASCLPKTCNEHHLTIVIVGAEWCGPCQKFEKHTLTDPAVKARLESGNYGGVKVDLDTNRAFANKYRVQAVPTIIFLTQDCEELGRSVGGKNADDFLQLLDTVDEKAKKK